MSSFHFQESEFSFLTNENSIEIYIFCNVSDAGREFPKPKIIGNKIKIKIAITNFFFYDYFAYKLVD